MLQGARILIKRTRARGRGRFNAALGRPASDNRKLPVSDNRELHTRRTRRSRRTCRGAPLQLVFGVLADLGESEGASAPRAAGPAKALCSPSNPGGRRRQFPGRRSAEPVRCTPTPNAIVGNSIDGYNHIGQRCPAICRTPAWRLARCRFNSRSAPDSVRFGAQSGSVDRSAALKCRSRCALSPTRRPRTARPIP